MQYAEALRLIGGLSKPSKMPWWGWSISAEACITGGKLQQVEGSVCSDCYALKGNYLWPDVKTAHQRRLAAIQDPRFVEAFVVVLNSLHEKQRRRPRENRFRWFDSGDLQSVEMLEIINEIAKQTPQIRHWLPTREQRLVRQYIVAGGALADNLTVRLSAPMIGEVPSRSLFDLPVAYVGVVTVPGVHQCPAVALQGNRCLDCSTCWSDANVNYPHH